MFLLIPSQLTSGKSALVSSPSQLSGQLLSVYILLGHQEEKREEDGRGNEMLSSSPTSAITSALANYPLIINGCIIDEPLMDLWK